MSYLLQTPRIPQRLAATVRFPRIVRIGPPPRITRRTGTTGENKPVDDVGRPLRREGGHATAVMCTSPPRAGAADQCAYGREPGRAPFRVPLTDVKSEFDGPSGEFPTARTRGVLPLARPSRRENERASGPPPAGVRRAGERTIADRSLPLLTQSSNFYGMTREADVVEPSARHTSADGRRRAVGRQGSIEGVYG